MSLSCHNWKGGRFIIGLTPKIYPSQFFVNAKVLSITENRRLLAD